MPYPSLHQYFRLASDLTDSQNVAVFTIGDVIRKLRDLSGWSQEELGKRAGVNKETIVRVEAGLSTTTDTLTRIAEALGSNVASLYALTLKAAPNVSDVEDEIVDVSGHTREDIPVIAEGEASPQGSLFWGDDGTLLSDVEDRITRPYDVRDPRAYGLRVRGDSMMRFYKPGDLVVVSPNTRVADGDEVYVQLLTGERLIKVVRRMGEGYLLESYNQSYEPRFVLRAAVGSMHPIVWSKRKASGQRATLVRASDIPAPKRKTAVREENGDPIWIDPEGKQD